MAVDELSPWDAARAIRGCSVRPWSGVVWRCHSRRYPGDDAGGSLKTTGRYHRGLDRYPISATWPALYTGLALHVALGERLRHTTAASISQLANQRMSRLHVTLHAVLNLCAPDGCADIGAIGLDFDALCSPREYERCHQIARAARDVGEAILVPSCTRFPEGNLVSFPDRLDRESAIVIDETQDPDLFIDSHDVENIRGGALRNE